MRTLKLNDYVAKIEYDDSADMFHGLIINIQDTVEFYGASVDELKDEFRASLDVYLAVCAEKRIKPAKPYSGTLNLRLGPELHGRVAESAAADDISLNAWLVKAIEKEANRTG